MAASEFPPREPGPAAGKDSDAPLSQAEEFLRNLYRMKRDSRTYLEEAEGRGDLREADEFREYLERVESMIEMNGGDPEL